MARSQQPDHGEPVGKRSGVVPLQRLAGSGSQQHPVQVEALQRGKRDTQVAGVGRIKRAAEKGEAHGAYYNGQLSWCCMSHRPGTTACLSLELTLT